MSDVLETLADLLEALYCVLIDVTEFDFDLKDVSVVVVDDLEGRQNREDKLVGDDCNDVRKEALVHWIVSFSKL